MTWDGCRWVSEHFPIHLTVERARPELGALGLAIRDNPRRVQLLVTSSLAKHVPVDPRDAIATAGALADEVRRLGAVEDGALLLGMAETATGLAELVAADLGVDYLHSTRAVTGSTGAAFSEAHSHAPAHRLAPASADFLAGRCTVIVVDDELTTAATVVNLLEAIRASSRLGRVVVACLVDARTDDPDDLLTQFARRTGITVEVCSLAKVSLSVGPEAQALAANFLEAGPGQAGAVAVQTGPPIEIELPQLPHPPRYGVSEVDLRRRLAFAESVAKVIQERLRDQPPLNIHVVGIEEQIAIPVCIAAALARDGEATVRVSSTTRSPAMVVDEPGYPLRSEIRFASDSGERRLYNPLRGPGVTIVVPDEDGLISSDLLAQLPGERVLLRWQSPHQ